MSEKKAETPKVKKTVDVTEEIVMAITPPDHPAGQNPGGIPVTDQEGREV